MKNKQKNSEIDFINDLLEKCLESYGLKIYIDGTWEWQVPEGMTHEIELEIITKSLDIIHKQGYIVVWDNGDGLMLIYKDPYYFTFVTYNSLGEFIPGVAEGDHILQGLDFFCMNCGEELPLCEKNNFSGECSICGWKNELIESFLEKPITITSDVYGVCYPPIYKTDLTLLPDKLKIAVKNYFREIKPSFVDIEKEYQLIYHSLFKKDADKFEQFAEKYKQKAKLTRFFQTYNLNHKQIA